MKVSVIVPVYNMEKYLNQCMDSLVNQTLKNIEIIVINDGSTDKSLEILNNYKKKYPNKVKIIDQENQGISVARNNGLKIASGKYVGFVDSDDYVEFDMFESLLNQIENSDSDIVICNYKEFNITTHDFKNISVVHNLNCENIYDDPSIINSIDYAPWNKLFKKDLFDDISFPKNLKYEDLNAILKVFLNAKKITKLDKYLYIYRIIGTSETRTINKKVKDILPILSDLIGYSKSINTYKVIKKDLEKMMVDKLFYYLIYSYQLNDKKFILSFRKEIIKFLSKNFKTWKITLLKNKKLNLKLISKLVLINNSIFKIYIERKCS